MYRQVHATSLPVNILRITCLSSCTQWLQEATPSTPLTFVLQNTTVSVWWLKAELTRMKVHGWVCMYVMALGPDALSK